MAGLSIDTRKVAAARLWASVRMPYLASAIFASTVVAEPDLGTIGIDNTWQLHADPELVAELTVDQLGALIVHLCGHVIRDHGARAQQLGVAEQNQRGRWNRSADAEINDDLVIDDAVPSVAPDLPADLACADGGLAERYYEDGRDGPRHWDCGSGADGCERPGDGRGQMDLPEAQLVRLQCAAEIQETARREPGTVPGGWLRWAESVLPSQTDWRRILAAEIRSAVAIVAGKVDYSYRRPSRRAHLNPRIVLPTLHRPIPDVAVVCDTSGSMHDGLLARALGEVESILARAGLRQAQVRVLAVDTAVQAVQRVSRAAQVSLAGGGGTDMGAGIAAAAALRPRPSVVIVLTDGYTPWPAAPPKGVRVIVGLLAQTGLPQQPAAPAWARTVIIEQDA